MKIYNHFIAATKFILMVMICFSLPDEGMGPLELHRYFLDNDPFEASVGLTKRERFSQGLPPDRYNERLFILTMDPSTGQPDVAAKAKTQQLLLNSSKNQERASAVPGQSVSQPWYSIGPNNQSGRVRAALFDEADTEKDRIIAGGVSGGLWLHEDIDNPTDQPWSRIQGVPGNLAVSNIVQDPGDFDIMYVGTGESYTSGDVTGNGIYKSDDGGTNWTQVFGSSSGIVTSTQNGASWLVNGYFYVNDLAMYDHDSDPSTTNWIYAALGMGNHKHMSNTYLDIFQHGLIYSTDEGATWTSVSINYNGTTNREHINDIEVQELSNRIWLSTTTGNGSHGGNFYYSDNGTTFTQTSSTWSPTITQTNVRRVEIEPSETNSATHYILANISGEAEFYKTTDNFTTINKLPEPDDVDTGIPANDFTRGQAFYDLEVEVDPNDDDIVYLGGIDWHRSTDGGQNWTQISKWSNNNNLFSLNVSRIHADQHGLYFRPGNTNQAVVVNDGGVAYVSSLSAASNSTTAFNEIEDNFITSQFYTAAQTPSGFPGDDLIFGGTQDNGTYRITNSSQNKSAGVNIYPGGDGAATFFDQVGGDYAIANYTYNDAIVVHNYNSMGQFVNYDDLSSDLSIPASEGDFINKAALDSNIDVYYANSSVGTNYKIRRINLNGIPNPTTSEITGLGAWPTAMEVSPHTTLSTNLYVGLIDGRILKITNADNASASAAFLTQPGLGSISDIHFGQTEDDLFVTYYNYGSSIVNVYYSSDGGTTWENKEGNDGTGDLPDIPVFSIQHNPYEEDEVIIGTELGIWRTSNFTDTHPNWITADEGMSDVAVFDIDFKGPSALDNRVLAATHGRGLFVGSFSANTNAPISQTDSITVAEGGTATTTTGGATSVLANDSDPDGDPITSSVVTNPLHASAFTVESSTGTFTYTHDGTETTTDTFSYRAFDGAVYGNTVSVTINITPVNDCPTVPNPVADISAQEDDPDEVINLSNVFADVENNPLSLTVSVTNTSLLSTTYNSSSGSLTLDYANNAFGTATVTINVDDGNGCTTTLDEFVVSVNGINDIPVANPETITVVEGLTATTTTGGDTSLLDNDTDADTGDTISTNVVSMPFHHSAFTVDSTTGTFTYTHDGSETSTDSFSYRVFDGTVYSPTVVVSITIIPDNDCPTVPNPVADFIAQEDDPDDIIDLTNVFADAENNTLNITVNNSNPALLTQTYNNTTKEITLDYINNQIGTATITINVDDNNGCTSTQNIFVVTVVPQNDAPVGNVDTIAVNESETVTTTTGAATSVLTNDTDMENDPLSATLITAPLHHLGSFALSSIGTFTYVHDGSETTTDTFTYSLSDGVSNVTVTATININPVNDCPIVSSATGSITVNEDAPDTTDDLTLRFSDADIMPTPNSLSYTVSPSSTSLATLTVNGSGVLTIAYKDNQTGTDTITITANDNAGCTVDDVFTLTVNPVNDPPVGFTESIRVSESGTVTQTTGGQSSLLVNDTDIESDPLTASLVNTPTNGTLTLTSSGTFTYVHDGSETTTDSFVYKPNDGTNDGNDVTVNISITPVNDCPFFDPALGGELTAFDWNEDNDSAGIYNIGSRITDPDSNPLTYTVTYTNSAIYGINQINPGAFDFVPVLNAFGSSVATITIDDGDGCVIESSFTVNVYPINDCPTVDNPIADVSVNEDANDLWIDIQNTFSDIESSTLTYSVMTTNNTLIATTLTATSLVIDFLDDQNGSTNVVLTVNDGDMSCTVDDAFNVSITSINDLPVANTDEISVVSGGSTTFLNDGVTTSLLANDTDVDGNPLTANLVTPPINGTLSLQANGTFTYTHDGSSTTTDTFYYRANDGFVNGATVSVTIYINNPPVAVADTIAVLESGTATTTTGGQTSLLWNDTDADPADVGSLTAIKVTDPTHGTLTLNSDGTFVYAHNGNNQSSDSFTYSASDGKITGTPITVSIAVTGTNDPPVAYDDTLIVALGGTATELDNGNTSFSTNDIDPDGDPLTISIVSSPSFGTITLNAGGTFSYTQDGTLNGGDSLTYRVNDGTVNSNIATVNIYLSCTPCTESIIEAGANGASFTYTDCLCKTVRVYVPKGRAYSFCHLDGSINLVAGNYTLITSSACN